MDHDVARRHDGASFVVEAKTVTGDVTGNGAHPGCAHGVEPVGAEFGAQSVEGVVAQHLASQTLLDT